MGHVAKVVETKNRFSALTGECDEGDHPIVDEKKRQTFTGKAKVNLTTRNLRKPTVQITREAKTEKKDSVEEDAKVTEKLIANAEKVNSALCQMTFHLTDVNKVLASVNKMTDAGNDVNFNRRKSYIQSPEGRKAHLRKRGGVYVLDVVFFNGETAIKGEVIVDSGAADHVMPKGMLTGITTLEKEKGTKFVAADGGELGNYGRKEVQFVPLEFWEAEFGSPFQGQMRSKIATS